MNRSTDLTPRLEAEGLNMTKQASVSFWGFLRDQLRPRGKVLTSFNVITAAIMALAAGILVVRFTQGLGAVSNIDQEVPWGLWKGFNVIAGVAFAGGAYVLTFLVYVMRLEHYHPIVRVTVLNGFLAYCFYAGALVLDLGRPWHIMNPIIGNSFGLASVLFLVAWHFLLYMVAQLVEFSPAIAEWLGARRIHRILSTMTVGAVILGITLSTLHQSALGALYLMAKPKVHPLWYTELIPVLFFISSIFAGLAMVIFEGTISHRVFKHRIGEALARTHGNIAIGLARIAGGAMFVYLFLQAVQFLHGQKWQFMGGGWGSWYLVEVLGFVAVPMLLLLRGSATRNLAMVRVGAVVTILGILLNRLNVSIVAFKWYLPVHYVPSWMELVVAASVICAEIWVFRWVILRMPVLGGEPAWAKHAHEEKAPARVPAVVPV